MATLPIHEFIETCRPQLIRRCKDRAAGRSVSPLPTAAEIDHGVPLFLGQLVKKLRKSHSQTDEINKGAGVHYYGGVCQGRDRLAAHRRSSL